MRAKSISLVFLTLSTLFIYGQNFEGEITYTNHFTSKMENFTNEQLTDMIGNRQEYLIKGGNYKSFLNGQSVSMQLYDHKTNRIYNRTPKSDTLFWFDASTNTDKVMSYELKKNAGDILNVTCDAIIMKTRTGTTTIFYSPKYKLDSSLYAGHHYNNWAFYVSKAGALPLKTIIETWQFRMESTATEIKKLQLGDDYFAIDHSAPIKKN